nr:hypothetical protein [Tanacetum cinerariifolium]
MELIPPPMLLLETKATQANEIASLKRSVENLERRNRSRTHKLKRLYKVGLTTRVESLDDEESFSEDASKQGRRIDDIDTDEDITLVNVQDDTKMFDADKDLGGEEVFVEQEVVDDKEEIDEVTLAQILAELKTLKPKEQRLAREKAQKEIEANIALIDTWDDVQAKIDVDYQFAERLQVDEKELSDDEKATLFMQLLEKRRKFFVLKSFEFDKIQEMFDKAFKRVNTFKDFRIKLVQGEGKEKRAGEELVKEILKKQKVEDDKETAKLKQLMEIIPDK